MSETLSLKDPLYDTGVEIKAIEQSITSSLNVNSKLIAWKAEILAGSGLLSHVIRVTLEWSTKDAPLPTSVILKQVTTSKLEELSVQQRAVDGETISAERLSQQREGTLELLRWAHLAECALYNFAMAKEWDVKIPVCYFASATNPTALILQDLSYGMVTDFPTGMSLGQCLETVECLASLHAYCYRNDDWKTFPELNDTGRDFVHQVTAAHFIGFSAEKMRELAAKECPEYSKETVEKSVSSPLSVSTRQTFDMIQSVVDIFPYPQVIVHGDLHVENLLFDPKDSHLLAILDWQGVHTGCLLEDLCRLICLSVDPAIRRADLETILQHYYDSLASEMAPRDVPFDFATLHNGFQNMFMELAGIPIYTLIMLAQHRQGTGICDKRDCDKLIQRAHCLLADCLQLIESS